MTVNGNTKIVRWVGERQCVLFSREHDGGFSWHASETKHSLMAQANGLQLPLKENKNKELAGTGLTRNGIIGSPRWSELEAWL